MRTHWLLQFKITLKLNKSRRSKTRRREYTTRRLRKRKVIMMMIELNLSRRNVGKKSSLRIS
jgi:hypothetical protein